MEENTQELQPTDANEHGERPEFRLTRRQFARYATAIGLTAAIAPGPVSRRPVHAHATNYPYRLHVAQECMVSLVVCGRLNLAQILGRGVNNKIWDDLENYIANAVAAAPVRAAPVR